jgi:hypothetical protein
MFAGWQIERRQRLSFSDAVFRKNLKNKKTVPVADPFFLIRFILHERAYPLSGSWG